MRLGVEFPDREIGTDPAVITDWAQAAEDLGYDFIIMGEHVLVPDQRHHEGLLGPYTIETIFRDPMVLYGFLAGVTSSIEFLTSILILPQRQTAVVAKQAADVDLLSGGRLMLGVGLGWNPAEYEALGQDFHTRGRRMEEQIELLRKLWREPVVTFEGQFDRINHLALTPRPEGEIPIWIGGMASRALDRIGRLADGWSPRLLWEDDRDRSVTDMLRRRERVDEAARNAGRDPSQIGLMLATSGQTMDEEVALAKRWEALGATHCALRTMTDASITTSRGGRSPAEHIAAIRAFREAFD